jgi:hypothetical protein
VPYSEALAEKVRGALAGTTGLTEKRMFGGIAFLVNGAMCVGVTGQGTEDPAGSAGGKR